MTDLFKTRIAAFQAFLEFPPFYAASIRTFTDDVAHRLENKILLEKEQAKLLLTQDVGLIRSVLGQFADLVEHSTVHLRVLLAEGDIPNAYNFCRGWPDSYWRYYETVIDMYVFEHNRHLMEPSEASRAAMNDLKIAFPANLNAAEVLEGADVLFQQQLLSRGNPWKG